MLLKRIIQHLPEARVQGSLNRPVRGIACDARHIGPGMLFVSLPSHNDAEEDFIHRAVERGATAFICSQQHRLPNRATRIEVPDVWQALAHAARSYYQNPSAKLKVIGIQGQDGAGNGSTPMAFMLKAIFEAAGQKTGLISPVHMEIGERRIPWWDARPSALEIQQALAQMVAAECQVCVMEMGADPAARKQIYGVDFDAMIRARFTGSSATRENDGKENPGNGILNGFKEWDKKKAAVMCVDAVFGTRSAQGWNPVVQLTDGIHMPSLLRAGHVHLGPFESRCVVELPKQRFACRLPSPQSDAVYWALGAAAAARALHLDERTIARGLQIIPPIPGHLEPVDIGQTFGVYVDQARTPARLEQCLQDLRKVIPGQLIVVLGSPGDGDQETRFHLGQRAALNADRAIFTTDNPRHESPLNIAAELAAGFHHTKSRGCEIVLDRAQAIRRAIRRARHGDGVLIAGKGHETCQHLENTIVPFDDREQAREELEMLAYSAA